jgi:hypothetical protein
MLSFTEVVDQEQHEQRLEEENVVQFLDSLDTYLILVPICFIIFSTAPRVVGILHCANGHSLHINKK